MMQVNSGAANDWESEIILVGHSWGSILGVHMVKARPGKGLRADDR